MELMTEIVQGKRFLQLPPDAKVVASQSDPKDKNMGLRVESSSFDPVPFTSQIPAVPAVTVKRG